VRRANPRRVKIHRNYAVDEAARLLGVHKNTVRAWIKSGLQTNDGRRPTLILGRHLSTFLHNRRKRSRQPCRPGQMYCVGCRAPKYPAGQIADYIPLSPSFGNLRGNCPDCGCLIHRRVSHKNLAAVGRNLQVSVAQAEEPIRDSAAPSQNRDFTMEAHTHEDA